MAQLAKLNSALVEDGPGVSSEKLAGLLGMSLSEFGYFMRDSKKRNEFAQFETKRVGKKGVNGWKRVTLAQVSQMSQNGLKSRG